MSDHAVRHESSTRQEDILSQNYVADLQNCARHQLNGTSSAAKHLENLSNYLGRWRTRDATPVHNQSHAADGLSSNNCNFLTFYDLRAPKSGHARNFRSPKDFSEATSSWGKDSPQSHLVFLRGNPTPSWLVAVGSRYGIAYEFLNQHLDFRASVGRPNYFMLPTLPSISNQTPRLSISTIGGLHQDSTELVNQTYIDSLRGKNAEKLRKFQEQMKFDKDIQLGDSFIRYFNTHDEAHFSLEQDISMYVAQSNESWAAIVWLDSGNDLGKGPASKWLSSPIRAESWAFHYFPTILPVSCDSPAGVYGHHQQPKTLSTQESPRKAFHAPTLSPSEYGKHLNFELASRDAFYALSGIFEYAAFAESQFLNLVASKISKETDLGQIAIRNNPSISNLHYTLGILERCAARLKTIVRFIEQRHTLEWPTAAHGNSEKQPQIDAQAQAQALLDDYKYLLEYSHSLLAACERGTHVVIQFLQMQEVKEQITEAKSVTTLTRLAFVFIPLSFIASVFGMNFHELGSGSLSIRVFFATGAPVFLASVMLLTGCGRTKRLLRKLWHHKTRGEPKFAL